MPPPQLPSLLVLYEDLFVNFYGFAGRGFNRGRAAPRREGFHGDRGFNTHTPGRGGRFNSAYSNNSFEASPSDFRARQAPPAFRGGLPIAIQKHKFTPSTF